MGNLNFTTGWLPDFGQVGGISVLGVAFVTSASSLLASHYYDLSSSLVYLYTTTFESAAGGGRVASHRGPASAACTLD